MPAFILVVIGVLSVLGLILGYVLCRYLPQSRWIFALVIVITIMPWLLHHLALLRFAEEGLAGEAGN